MTLTPFPEKSFEHSGETRLTLWQNSMWSRDFVDLRATFSPSESAAPRRKRMGRSWCLGTKRIWIKPAALPYPIPLSRRKEMQVLRLGTRKKPRTVSRHRRTERARPNLPFPLHFAFVSRRDRESAVSNICETIALRPTVPRFARRYYPAAAAEYSIRSRGIIQNR